MVADDGHSPAVDRWTSEETFDLKTVDGIKGSLAWCRRLAAAGFTFCCDYDDTAICVTIRSDWHPS